MSILILLAIKLSKDKTTNSKGPCIEDPEGGLPTSPQPELASRACDPADLRGPTPSLMLCCHYLDTHFFC